MKKVSGNPDAVKKAAVQEKNECEIRQKLGRKLLPYLYYRNAIVKVGLDPDDKKKVGKYSLGMRQRLGIAQAIMENRKP